MTKGLYETMIKAKIYMWHVNFTERRAWFVNVWTSLRCDLPPKVNVTHNCLLSTRENLMISLKTFMQEERFEVPLSFTWRVNFSNNRTWNEIGIRPSPPPHLPLSFPLNMAHQSLDIWQWTSKVGIKIPLSQVNEYFLIWTQQNLAYHSQFHILFYLHGFRRFLNLFHFHLIFNRDQGFFVVYL